MPTYPEGLKCFLSEVRTFLLTTLKTDTLSKHSQKERTRLTDLLQKLYTEHSDLRLPISGDDGSNSSSKDGSAGSNENEDDIYSNSCPDKAIKDITNPFKLGFLDWKNDQRRFSSKSWQKCYCVLDSTSLYCFKNPKDDKQMWTLRVKDFELVKSTKKDCYFDLVYPGKKPVQFSTQVKDDRESWAKAFEKAKSSKPVTEVVETVTPETDEEDNVYNVPVEPLKVKDEVSGRPPQLPQRRISAPVPSSNLGQTDSLYEEPGADSNQGSYEFARPPQGHGPPTRAAPLPPGEDDDEGVIYEELNDGSTRGATQIDQDDVYQVVDQGFP